MAFVIDISSGWRRAVRSLTDAQVEEIAIRLHQLQEGFGKPHLHAGLGIRRLSKQVFEFRVSLDLRVVFLFLKPNIFRLEMCGTHDEVRRWLKGHS